MRRGGLGFGGLALAIALAAAASAEDAVVELEESAEQDCVAGCEARHEDCVRAAQTTRGGCEAKRRACDDACAPCLHLQGPPVVYCVQECENCRAELKRLPCAPATDAHAACGRARDACLRECR